MLPSGPTYKTLDYGLGPWHYPQWEAMGLGLVEDAGLWLQCGWFGVFQHVLSYSDEPRMSHQTLRLHTADDDPGHKKASSSF